MSSDDVSRQFGEAMNRALGSGGSGPAAEFRRKVMGDDDVRVNPLGGAEAEDASGPQVSEEPLPQRAVDPSQGRGTGDAIRRSPSDEFAEQMKDILGPIGIRRNHRKRYNY